jgi:hypothetical protein
MRQVHMKKFQATLMQRQQADMQREMKELTDKGLYCIVLYCIVLIYTNPTTTA